MSSFHEVQGKLLLSCEDGILDEDELIGYYTSNLCPKNPNFLHEEYDRFSLNETNDAECLAECRFRKHDLQILSEVLQIPNSSRCYQRSVVDGMEGLYLPLRRLLKIAITTVYRLILLRPLSFTEYSQLENFRFGANIGM